MTWSTWLFGSLIVLMVAACSGERRTGDAQRPENTGTETGTMQTDTAPGGARIHSDTNKPAPGTGAGHDSAGAPKGDSIRVRSDSGASSNY